VEVGGRVGGVEGVRVGNPQGDGDGLIVTEDDESADEQLNVSEQSSAAGWILDQP